VGGNCSRASLVANSPMGSSKASKRMCEKSVEEIRQADPPFFLASSSFCLTASV